MAKARDTQPKVLMNSINKREVVVELTNNISGNFFYTCPKTGMKIDLMEFGDKEEITLDQLITMKNTSKVILEDLWVLITDVFYEGLEKKDIISYLNLDRFYKDREITEDYIDNLILSTSKSEFEVTLKEMGDGFKQRVSERAVNLYREEQFSDIFKMKLLMEITKDESLFEI